MMKKNGAVLEKQIGPKKNNNCRHHWLIERALGPTSRGICRFCGAEKIFLNIVEETESKSNLSRFFDTEIEDELEKEIENEEIN